MSVKWFVHKCWGYSQSQELERTQMFSSRWLDNKSWSITPRNPMQSGRGTNYWYTRQPGHISYTSCQVEGAAQKNHKAPFQPDFRRQKITPGCSLEGLMLKLKLQYFGHLMQRVDSLEKTDTGRDWGQEEKGTTQDEMAGWHHRLDGLEFEWTPGVGDGQGGLACCDSWGRKESDTTERLNWTELNVYSRQICLWFI